MENIKDIKPCFEMEKDGTTYVCMGTFDDNLRHIIVEYKIRPFRCGVLGFYRTPMDYFVNPPPYIDHNETIFFVKDEWFSTHSEITLPETHEYAYTLHEDEHSTSEFELELDNTNECGHAVYSEKNNSWITYSHPDYQYTLGNSTTLHVARLKKGVNLEPESEPKRPASALYNEINTAIQNHSNNNGEYDINLLKIRDLIKNSL